MAVRYYLHDRGSLLVEEIITVHETEEAVLDAIRFVTEKDESVIENTRILLRDGYYIEADGNHHLYYVGRK